MARTLPLRAHLGWLKKTAKQQLVTLRQQQPEAQLSDAQFQLAREYGFASWRALVEHVNQRTVQLQALTAAGVQEDPASLKPDDVDVVQLFAAVRSGNRAEVETLLRRRPQLVHARDASGMTPLHLAAECNDPTLGIVMLAFGADAEATYGQSAHTPLSWAVTTNALAFAATLSKVGVEPDLFTAAGMGDLAAVQRCFAAPGLPETHRLKTGSSRFTADGSRLPCPPVTAPEQVADALYMACRNGHAEVVRFLLTQQPDLRYKGYLGAGLLHWAYFGNSMDVVNQLLAAGLDPQERDPALGCTPREFGLCISAQWGQRDLVQRQLERDPSLRDDVAPRARELAEAEGHTGIVELLNQSR